MRSNGKCLKNRWSFGLNSTRDRTLSISGTLLYHRWGRKYLYKCLGPTGFHRLDKCRHYLTDFICVLILFCLQNVFFMCWGLTLRHGSVVQIVPDQPGLESRTEEPVSGSTVGRNIRYVAVLHQTFNQSRLTLTPRRTFCSTQQSGLQILWCRGGEEARWVPQPEPGSVWQFPPGVATRS